MTKKEMQSQALANATQNRSVMNYASIFNGFMARGIPENDIQPRENVFTAIAEFLSKVWDAEVGHSSDLAEVKRPDFERIAKNSQNNVRDALSVLEIELLAA